MANNTKQQAINTFTGGLNTDLHPLTTPNDILTDCINGTVITYNGNEYILQNDMGNYKLDKAKLYADYIPIGIKEYGNIIYIVSYNPIDKKCQIGSYPSPQTLFDNSEYGSKNENYQGVPTYTLDLNWTWPTNTKWLLSDGIVNIGSTKEDPTGDYNKDVLFTNTKPNQNLRVFFPADGLDLKDTFLNPGDKYYLKKEEGEDSHWKFQRCEYYTLTESKEALPIEEGLVISDPNDYAPEKLRNVTWETPGWLAYKPSLIEPASFDLYLTDIKIPSFLTSTSTRQTGEGTGELSFNVQGQLTINTTGDWKDYYDNLKVYFDYSYAGGSWENNWDNGSHINSEEKGIPTNYGNTIDILTFNNKKSLDISKEDIENNKTVIIRATPYIIDDIYGIVYDNLAVTYTINLGELYSINEIETFSVYKYLSDDEGVTINFSIISPTSNLSQITCKYRIHDISEKFVGVGENATDYTDIDSLNLLGQNVLSINYGTDENLSWFKKENIYVFELAFFNISDWNNYIIEKEKGGKIELPSPIYQTAEFLITSSVLNDFYTSDDQYQLISLKRWTNNIKKYVEINKEVHFGELTNIDSYCRYAKVFNPSSIFDKDYYLTIDDSSWKINDPEDPSVALTSKDTETLRDAAVSSIIDSEKNISASTHYGSIGAYVGNLPINIYTPVVLNNTGIWKENKWKTDVTYTVKNSTNATTLEKSYSSKTLTLEVGRDVEDSSIYIVNARGIFNLYNADLYNGNGYKRWYLYRNLTYLKEICDTWIQNVINEQQPTLTEDVKDNLSKLKVLKNNSGIISENERRAITYLQSSSSSNRRKLYLMLKSASDYNFSSFTLKGHYYDNHDGEVLSKDWPTITDFDNYFSRRLTSNYTFIPVYFDTNTRGGNGGEKRIWTFPDKSTPWHSSGDCRNSAGFAILCKDGGTISVALIQAFGPIDNPPYAGTFYTGSDGSSTSQMLITSNTKASSSYISKNMLWNFAMYMLVLGVQIYGVYDLEPKSRSIIGNRDQISIYDSDEKYTITYKRSDLLDSITYKGINFLSEESLEKIEPESFISSIIKKGSYKMSFNNIIGGEKDKYQFVKTNLLTNSLSGSYNFPFTLTNLDIIHSDFIHKLDTSLQKIIAEFIVSQSYNDNTVLCDLNTDTRISRYLKGLVSNFTFEYKNNKGYIYYKGLPESTFGGRYDDRYFNDIRYLEWTNIEWSDLHEGFKLSSAFLETELNS